MEIQRLGPAEVERYKVIRLRSLNDAPDAFGSTSEEVRLWDETKWEAQMQLPTWVAVVNGRDAGLVRIWPENGSPEVGYLVSMWVAPEARRQKTGGALIDAAVNWARANGFKTLKLDVGDYNGPAIGLYASRGFVPNGIVSSMPEPRGHISEHQRELTLRSDDS